ncbi:MAG: tetratricopeptide repeat protein [Oligoflexales bacterium]|nr:tetratricopeptide repeat protein [Oligoflexales bacterium]
MGSTELNIIVVTKNEVLFSAISSYFRFLQIPAKVIRDENGYPKTVNLENMVLFLDFTKYEVFEIRELITVFRSIPNFCVTPIVAFYFSDSDLDILFLNDFEFVWLLKSDFKSSNIISIIREINHLVQTSREVLLLRKELEFAYIERQYVKCLSILDKIQPIYKNRYICHLIKAKLFFNIQKWNESLQAADQAIRSYPRSITPRLLVASIYHRAGHKDKVTKTIEDILLLPVAKRMDIVALKIYNTTGLLMDEGRSENHPGEGDPYWINYEELERKNVAITRVNTTFPQAEDFSIFYNFLAIICNSRKSYHEAEKNFKASLFFLKDKSFAYKIWYNLALTQIHQNQLDKARRLLEKAVTLSPRDFKKPKELLDKVRKILNKKSGGVQV